MAKRKTEVKALADILREERFNIEKTDDGEVAVPYGPEDYAWDCIKQLDSLREERTVWHVVVKIGEKGLVSYGPYPSPESASKAVHEGKLPAVQVFKKYGITPTYHPSKVDRKMEGT